MYKRSGSRWDKVCDRAEDLIWQPGELQPVNPETWETLLMLAVLAVGPVLAKPAPSCARTGPVGDDSFNTPRPMKARRSLSGGELSAAEEAERSKRREDLKATVAQLVRECPKGFVPGCSSGRRGQMLDAETGGGRTAISCVILAAVHHNLKYSEAIQSGSLPASRPDAEVLAVLLAQKADPFLPKGHKNALAKAVDSNYDDAAKILFERMKHVLISKGSERTLQVAFSSFLDFEPFDLFKPMAENFVLTPGKTLLNLVHLARNCRRATKLMKTANTEVMRKYEQVAQQCPLVMHALLQTLDVSQLFSLFFETQHGSALLLEMVSFDMEGDMDDVLASEEVYVIIDKRWNGRLWRTITRRNARDGSYLPIWKAVVFFCVFFFYALPLNLAILPLCVMFPTFKSWVKNRISEDDGSGSSGGGHGKGRTGVGGVQRSRSRRDSLLDFFGSEASRKKRGSNAEPSEARYYGDAAPGIGWLKPLLGITISRKGLYLLETPGICLTIYIAAQLVFTALFIAVELPTNGNLNPAPQLRFVLMFWAASNAWLGV